MQISVFSYKKGDFIVMDKNIYQLFNFDNFCKDIFLVDANEENKNIYTSLKILDDMLDNGFNKINKLIVIGGGITQDISSFIAGVLKRGIDWIFIPKSSNVIKSNPLASGLFAAFLASLSCLKWVDLETQFWHLTKLQSG